MGGDAEKIKNSTKMNIKHNNCRSRPSESRPFMFMLVLMGKFDKLFEC